MVKSVHNELYVGLVTYYLKDERWSKRQLELVQIFESICGMSQDPRVLYNILERKVNRPGLEEETLDKACDPHAYDLRRYGVVDGDNSVVRVTVGLHFERGHPEN